MDEEKFPYSKKSKIMIYLILFGIIFLIFKNWFSLGSITSGDFSYFYPEQIRQYLNFPFAWETFRESGLGGISYLFQGVYLYNLPLGFLGQYFKYEILERLVWFFPLIIIGIISPYILVKQLKLFPKKYYPLSILIFFLNTYFLMIMGGGQLTVVLAYIMVPLVFALFLKAYEECRVSKIVVFALALSVLIAWDFRIAYLYTFLNFFYIAFLPRTKTTIKKIVLILLFSMCIILGIHSFWIIAFILNYSNPVASLSSAYNTETAVRYFSSASYPQAISLLQPNWPENIFGKTYFMRWEYLFIPLLAYCHLLLNRKKTKANFRIIFFTLIGLIATLLAKGANPPFGEFYIWIFKNIPGMVMFRDPTKFYTLISLSYSIIIPYSIYKIYDLLGKINIRQEPAEYIKIIKYLPKISFILFILYLFFLIKPAWTGELGGIYQSKIVPREYVDLKNYINNQSEFFRTFWIPQQQRFGFYTDNHPAINSGYFLNIQNNSKIVSSIKMEEIKKLLSLASVKYIILPYDSEGEIFIKDRKYNDKERQELESELNQIPYLKKINMFHKNAVYEIQSFKDHFWLEDNRGQEKNIINNRDNLYWIKINPTKYKVQLNITQPKILIFSENFNPKWVAYNNGDIIYSQKIYDRFNSFNIKNTGNIEIIVEFSPQRYIYIGSVITFLTLLFCIFFFMIGILKKDKKFV